MLFGSWVRYWHMAMCFQRFVGVFRAIYGLARLTPARPDRNGNGPVPAYFFSVLQSGFLAHACSMPACLHQNFEGNLKEHLFGLKKD